MLPRVALVLIVAAGGSGMRTRETVERTVMVRTTGSDLQPAATGYVYKKKHDGEESLVEMGESEIMKRLSQFYDRPNEFPGLGRASAERRPEPGTAGERRAAPVTEKDEDRPDGLADEDYKKIFDDYSPTYENHGYDDYLRSSKRFRGGLHGEYNGDSSEENTGYGSDHHGEPGFYRGGKSESSAAAGGHDAGPGDEDHRRHHERDHREDKPKIYHSEEYGSGFHKIYDNKKDYNDHDYFGKIQAFPDARKYYETYDTEYKYDGPYKSIRYGHQHGGAAAAGGPGAGGGPGAEPGAARPAEEGPSVREPDGDHTPGSPRAEGESFGFKVQH